MIINTTLKFQDDVSEHWATEKALLLSGHKLTCRYLSTYGYWYIFVGTTRPDSIQAFGDRSEAETYLKDFHNIEIKF